MKKIFLITLLCVLAVSFVFLSFANTEQLPTPRPVTDCKATLEAWGNPPNCYCPCDTCRPVCTEPQKPKPEGGKESSSLLIAMETEGKEYGSSQYDKKENDKKDEKSWYEKVKEKVKEEIDEALGRPKGTDPHPVIGVRG